MYDSLTGRELHRPAQLAEVNKHRNIYIKYLGLPLNEISPVGRVGDE